MDKGYVQIFCGNGDGKSSAAIGKGIFSAIEGKRVIIIQFMKRRNEDEAAFFEQLEPQIKMFRFEKSDTSFDEMSDKEREEEIKKEVREEEIKKEEPCGSSKWKAGSYLYSQFVTKLVSLALKVFTSVFGMGTGVSPLLLPPAMVECFLAHSQLHNMLSNQLIN